MLLLCVRVSLNVLVRFVCDSLYGVACVVRVVVLCAWFLC